MGSRVNILVAQSIPELFAGINYVNEQDGRLSSADMFFHVFFRVLGHKFLV